MCFVRIGFGQTQELPMSPRPINQSAMIDASDKSVSNVPKCFCCNEKIFQMPTPLITGTDKICKDSKNVFNTIGCEGAAITWSTNPAGINFTGQGTSQIVIDYSSVPSTASAIVLMVEIKCGNKFVKNSIKVATCKHVEVKITKGEDALIHCLASQANINYGNFDANMASNWTFKGPSALISSVLKFDLSGIPTNATIISATLLLKEYCNPSMGGTNLYSDSDNPNDLTIERITGAWTEGAATCNVRPTTTTSGSITLPSVQGSWTAGSDNPAIPVGAMVTAMLQNNQGFLIRLTDPNVNKQYRARSFGSFNNSNPALRPVLLVVYQ